MAEPVKLPEPIKGLKNDKEIWIAVGKSRSDKKWQNKEMKWSVFLRRFKEPTRTQESYKDFLKMSATEQGRIKDVGGFVGGTLEGGRRKADAVKERYLLAFDLDFATTDFLEEFDMLCLNASMIYSTHKHSPEKPRYRLIMPTSRPVTPDEYEALMRIVAKELDIMPLLDPSTFQPSRLMYWASCSQDAEYVFRYWDLPFIDPDEWLAKLPDWTDISFWPVHPDEYRVDKTKRGQKQQDPTEKKNLVGVFCRTYDVPAAISTFLADIYEPTVNEDRYTYRPGSTSGGLVIYDDGKFCYSNHGTDPASGMDLNAFDLVRVHLFGDEDDNAKDDTPVNRMPSFKAMEDFVKEDPDCKMTMLHERAQSAAEDFDDDFDPEALEVVDDDWMKKLLSSEDSGVSMSNGDPVIDMAIQLFTSLMMLAVQIDNKNEDEKMEAATDAAVNKVINISSLVPTMKSCTIAVSENGMATLTMNNGQQQFSHVLTNAETSRLSQALNDSGLSQESKQQRVAGIINSIVISQQVSQNYNQAIENQETEQLMRR